MLFFCLLFGLSRESLIFRDNAKVWRSAEIQKDTLRGATLSGAFGRRKNKVPLYGMKRGTLRVVNSMFTMAKRHSCFTNAWRG